MRRAPKLAALIAPTLGILAAAIVSCSEDQPPGELLPPPEPTRAVKAATSDRQAEPAAETPTTVGRRVAPTATQPTPSASPPKPTSATTNTPLPAMSQPTALPRPTATLRFTAQPVPTPTPTSAPVTPPGVPAVIVGDAVFAPAVASYFWMYNMRFPLDMVWISHDCSVVDITPNVPAPAPGTPASELPYYSSSSSAGYTLEINAGHAERNGIEIGASVKFANVTTSAGLACP